MLTETNRENKPAAGSVNPVESRTNGGEVTKERDMVKDWDKPTEVVGRHGRERGSTSWSSGAPPVPAGGFLLTARSSEPPGQEMSDVLL